MQCKANAWDFAGKGGWADETSCHANKLYLEIEEKFIQGVSMLCETSENGRYGEISKIAKIMILTQSYPSPPVRKTNKKCYKKGQQLCVQLKSSVGSQLWL